MGIVFEPKKKKSFEKYILKSSTLQNLKRSKV